MKNNGQEQEEIRRKKQKLSYHGSYEWIILLEKCGRLDLTVFHLISLIGTDGNWKESKSWVPFWS